MTKKMSAAPKVIVKTVSFRASLPLTEKYRTVHLELTADVPPGASTEQVLEHLKLEVAANLIALKNGDKNKKSFEELLAYMMSFPGAQR